MRALSIVLSVTGDAMLDKLKSSGRITETACAHLKDSAIVDVEGEGCVSMRKSDIFLEDVAATCGEAEHMAPL